MNIDNIEWTYLEEPTYNIFAGADVIAVGKSYEVGGDNNINLTHHYQLAGSVHSVDIEDVVIYEEEE